MEETKRILIVDDEKLNINVLVDLLKPDYKIMAAKSGEKALKAAHSKKPPDLVLLDIMMPEMDGYEVLEHVKSEKHKSIIIVISADIQPEARDRVMKSGALDFIRKPVNSEKLREVLETYGLL